MKQYDYLIVGAGLYGAVFAHEAKKAGKRCLVIDKRAHIAGNIYTEEVEGINVHRYGAHIFHTNNKAVWQYVNQFAEFNRYTNSPVANYHGETRGGGGERGRQGGSGHVCHPDGGAHRPHVHPGAEALVPPYHCGDRRALLSPDPGAAGHGGGKSGDRP